MDMEELLNYIQPVDETTMDVSDIWENLKELCSELLKKYAELVVVGAFYANIMTIPVAITTPDTVLDATEIVTAFEEIQPAYKRTLDEIGRLEEDWDGYDAPPIDKKAIAYCGDVMSRLPKTIADEVKVLPSEFGGVQIKRRLANATVISCEFGDKTMSYYIDVPGQKTEFNDFLEYSSENIAALVRKIQTLDNSVV